MFTFTKVIKFSFQFSIIQLEKHITPVLYLARGSKHGELHNVIQKNTFTCVIFVELYMTTVQLNKIDKLSGLCGYEGIVNFFLFCLTHL